MQVFISWSGDRSRRLAKSLVTLITGLLPEVTPYVSFEDDPGKRWQMVLNLKLSEAHFGILCVTPGNIVAPWLIFEAGALCSKIPNNTALVPYLFDLVADDLPEQLKQLGACPADYEGTWRLVKAINNVLPDNKECPHDEQLLKKNFNFWWKETELELHSLLCPNAAGSSLATIAEAQPKLWRAIHEIKKAPFFLKNDFYKELVAKCLNDFMGTLRLHGAHFDLPYVLYPAYLIQLLQKYEPVVKAVACVEAIEHFWRQNEGDLICEITPKDSTRVFVFRTRELLRGNLDLLRRHAKQYNVAVMSYDTLITEWRNYAEDFSIIGSENPLLAKYVNPEGSGSGTSVKQIRFSSLPEEICRYQNALEEIIVHAFKVDDHGQWHPSAQLRDLEGGSLDNIEDRESFIDATFGYGKRAELQPIPRMHVEMSGYIDVLDYDTHEINHPYYQNMMAKMLEIFAYHRKPSDLPTNILECGAGTGIFTTMLMQLPHVDITALEIDWLCYNLLCKNVERMRKVTQGKGSSCSPICKDSRTTNPEGKFDFIFSSFADHHIYRMDKVSYFRNVRRNLGDGALFIVGDEFLPEYEHGNEAKRRHAINTYHDHIIKIATAEGHAELVKLEEAARKCGLEDKGDHKVSPDEYKKLIREARLNIVAEYLIGPPAPECHTVGGIRVYEIKASS